MPMPAPVAPASRPTTRLPTTRRTAHPPTRREAHRAPRPPAATPAQTRFGAGGPPGRPARLVADLDMTHERGAFENQALRHRIDRTIGLVFDMPHQRGQVRFDQPI